MHCSKGQVIGPKSKIQFVDMHIGKPIIPASINYENLKVLNQPFVGLPPSHPKVKPLLLKYIIRPTVKFK
jgi:hypothetical protein